MPLKAAHFLCHVCSTPSQVLALDDIGFFFLESLAFLSPPSPPVFMSQCVIKGSSSLPWSLTSPIFYRVNLPRPPTCNCKPLSFSLLFSFPFYLFLSRPIQHDFPLLLSPVPAPYFPPDEILAGSFFDQFFPPPFFFFHASVLFLEIRISLVVLLSTSRLPLFFPTSFSTFQFIRSPPLPVVPDTSVG